MPSNQEPIQLSKLLPDDWAFLIQDQLQSGQFKDLEEKLTQAYAEFGDLIQPSPDNIFRALRETPLHHVKVVILGQDPYQTPGLAQGLAFSIPKEIKPGWRAFPSSLRNISKAIALDGYQALTHGDLTHWAKQGVLLLNASLTVQLELAGSHANIGWQAFTDALIQALAAKENHIIWLLWGSHAQKKKPLIKSTLTEHQKQHVILCASHPSGLSVYKTNEPFIYPGDTHSCGHFKQVNQLLEKHGQTSISWNAFN